MKNLFLSIVLLPLLAIPYFVKAQTDTTGSNADVITGIDTVPGASVEALQKQAKYFFTMQADVYNKTVANPHYQLFGTTLVSDSNYMVGKVRAILYLDYAYILEINVRIDFKSERYRYKFEDYRVIKTLDIEGKKPSKVAVTADEINAKLYPLLHKVESDLKTTMHQTNGKDNW